MNFRKILIYVASTSSFVLCYYLIFFILVYNTFDLGPDTLQEERNEQWLYLLVTLAAMALTAGLIIRWWKRGHHAAVAGACTASLLVLTAAGYYTRELVISDVDAQTFDQQVWLKAQEKPLPMAYELVEKKSLIGKTAEEVTALLGEPGGKWPRKDGEVWYYHTNQGGWDLSITFQGEVQQTEIYRPGLSLNIE